MGKTTGFIEISRKEREYESVPSRLKHYREFIKPIAPDEISDQGARCMDCGIPYCHQGCPVNNLIPEWNDLVYKKDWFRALEILHSTNNFPEFTGRICPAPCEASCTLNLTDNPVTIKNIECSIVDMGWKEGWIVPQKPKKLTGKKVAVIGSGPSGLACAQQLARTGHIVTVYEKSPRIGGLLRIGIPDFKMEKKLIDQRIKQMEDEGVTFKANVFINENKQIDQLKNKYDAIAICTGAEIPRDLNIENRSLKGIHFAMEFLSQQNDRVAGKIIKQMEEEGVTFRANVFINENKQIDQLKNKYDAIAICTGAEIPRDLNIENRNLKGIHFAMEFLSQQNDRVAGKIIKKSE